MSVSVVAFGECMLELARDASGTWRVGYAGDTYNTAVYLARLGVPVAYLTAVGQDPFSAEMLERWDCEGIDCSLALVDRTHSAGIYAIETDKSGERQFFYWREQSAARHFFKNPLATEVLEKAARTDLLYLSGITLSLFTQAERTLIIELCERVRACGGRVAFDPNYRSRGWPHPDDAKAAINSLAPYVNIALPTFEDEACLFGDASPAVTAERWGSFGASEMVIKLGASGCLVVAGDEELSVPTQKVAAKDTTGAGDSFNAAYLAGRLTGAGFLEAAQRAHRLASEVVQHAGAIIPRDLQRDNKGDAVQT